MYGNVVPAFMGVATGFPAYGGEAMRGKGPQFVSKRVPDPYRLFLMHATVGGHHFNVRLFIEELL